MKREYEIYPAEETESSRKIKITVQSVDDGCILTAVWRWTGRFICREEHRGNYALSTPGPHRSPLLSRFIEKALANSVHPPTLGQVDPMFAESYPALHSFLTTREITLPGGEVVQRQTATLYLFLGLTGPQAFLNDRASQKSLCGSADTFLGTLDALEALLTSEQVPWRLMDRHVEVKSTTSRKKKT